MSAAVLPAPPPPEVIDAARRLLGDAPGLDRRIIGLTFLLAGDVVAFLADRGTKADFGGERGEKAIALLLPVAEEILNRPDASGRYSLNPIDMSDTSLIAYGKFLECVTVQSEVQS